MQIEWSEFLTPVRAAVAATLLVSVGANPPAWAADLEFDNPVMDGASAGAGLLWSVEAEIAAGYSFVDFNAHGGGASRDLVDDANWPSLVGDLRAAIPLAGQFGLQLDLGGFRGWPSKLGENTSTGGDGGGLGWYRYGGGHLSYRDPSSHAFGVFGMYGQAFGGEDTASTQDLAENFVIGAEAQWYGEQHTLYMQAGYLDGTQVDNKAGYPTSDDRDVLDDAWFARGVARYFPDDNTRIQGEFTYVDGEQVSEVGLDLMALSWEARFDRQVDGLWGYYVAYHGVHVAQTGPASEGQCCEYLTDHTILAGIRLQLGSTTLLQQDRHGVTFSMPDVGRWGAYTTEAIDTGN